MLIYHSAWQARRCPRLGRDPEPDRLGAWHAARLKAISARLQYWREKKKKNNILTPRRWCENNIKPNRVLGNFQVIYSFSPHSAALLSTQTLIEKSRLQTKCDGTRWRREGKWRGNWRIEWVASTLHTTLELGVSSITTADAHNSVASSRLNWRPCRFKWTRPFRRKTKTGFCSCASTFQT